MGTNRYAYAGNSPVNMSDPGGNEWYNDWRDFKDTVADIFGGGGGQPTTASDSGQNSGGQSTATGGAGAVATPASTAANSWSFTNGLATLGNYVGQNRATIVMGGGQVVILGVTILSDGANVPLIPEEEAELAALAGIAEGVAAKGTVANEGIYQFTASSEKTYVGQSVNIAA